jgi:transcriptional regulator with XRE-family HTH domain
MPEPSSPTVRRRRLAAELRRLRERAGLIGEQVAERMGWSASKVSRIENAHTTPRPSEIKELLLLYGIDGQYAEQLLALAREANRKGWWEGYSGALPDAHTEYIGLEAEAKSSLQWGPEFAIGLMMTEAYTRQMIRDNTRSIAPIPPGEIERRIEARMIRQQILKRDPPFRLKVALDESVLRRRVGSNGTMRAQLDQLLELSEYDNINLRILSLDSPHPIITGGFNLLQFGEAHDVSYRDVVYLEHLTGGLYFEEERETYQYHLAFERLSDFSATPEESRNIIVKARDSWK